MIDRLFIVGKGASLKGFNFSILKDEYTLCLNHAVFEVPNPSALCFIDENFYSKYKEWIDDFKGDVFTVSNTGHPDGKKNFEGYSILAGIYALNESLNIAKNIYLLGYDLKSERTFPYFKEFPNMTEERWYQDFPTYYHDPTFIRIRLDVIERDFKKYDDRIFNCNPDSGIKTFKYKNIKEVLSEDS